MNRQIINWGIAGLGNIAHRFARDFVDHVNNARLVGVASRNRAQAEKFATQFSVAHSFDSYAALAQSTDLDAVYLSTIHPYHFPVAKLLLEHGKHLLVEKPTCTNTRDWRELAALAESKGLVLVEAMKTVTFPAYRQLRDFLQRNHIQLDFVEAAFGSENTYDSSHWLFNATQSGGAALDVGIYPVWLYCDLCALLGLSPGEPRAEISTGLYNAGVDEEFTLHFDGPLAAKLEASITRDLPGQARLSGPEVEILIHNKWWNPQYIEIRWQGRQHVIDAPVAGGGFQFEAQHVSELIRSVERHSALIPQQTSMQAIGFIERSLGSHGLAHLSSGTGSHGSGH